MGAFVDARAGIWGCAFKGEDKEEEEREEVLDTRPGKRRKVETAAETDIGEHSRRQTRSMRSRGPMAASATAPNGQADDVVEIEDSEVDEDQDYAPDDGLVACPICSTRMREREVDPHIDGECDGTKKEDKRGSESRSRWVCCLDERGVDTLS